MKRYRPRRTGGFLPDRRYRHFHPVYLFKFIQKYIILYFLPLLRALFLWNLAAVWVALQQGALLFALAVVFAAIQWRASGWRIDNSGAVHIRQGVLWHQHLILRGEELAALRTDRSLALRLVGAGCLTLYTRRVRRGSTLTLYLPWRDCRLLAGQLMPAEVPPFYRPLGAEQLSLLILGMNAAATFLLFYAALHETQSFGAWAEQVALAEWNRVAIAAATWLPVGTAWLLTGAACLVGISFLRSFFHTRKYKVYKTDEVILSRGGLLHLSECRVRIDAVSACDIRATPAARLLHCYPVYLVAGAYHGGELPTLLYRSGHTEVLAQLLPGVALPPAGRCSTKGRSFVAFLTVSGPLTAAFLLMLLLSVRILPDLAPAFGLGLALSAAMAAIDLDGRTQECLLRRGPRLTARCVRLFTLHTYCFWEHGTHYTFFQSPWACAVQRANIMVHLPGNTRIKLKSIPLPEAETALSPWCRQSEL